MAKRSSGILLPVYALPSRNGCGTLGKECYNFIEWMALAKQSIWEVLPIGPTGESHSPYQSYSSFAGNPLFIDIDLLRDEGLLSEDEINAYCYGYDAEKVDYELSLPSREKLLRLAFQRGRDDINFLVFKRNNAYWLKDYALYTALHDYFNDKPWNEWPDDGLRKYSTLAIEKYSDAFKPETEYYSFLQFKFYQQWEKALNFAHSKGVKIFGEINAFPALDSSDVWAHQDLFLLDVEKQPEEYYAVPATNYRASGKILPAVPFDWRRLKKDGYLWWVKCLEFNFSHFDFIKIRNFASFDKYFSVSAQYSDANYGKWHSGPGEDFVKTVLTWFGLEKFIAVGDENEVFASDLAETFGLSKMRNLQAAFKKIGSNPNLPHSLDRNCVLYTSGIQDYSLKTFEGKAPKLESDYAKLYCQGLLGEDLPWAMIRAALASVADIVIIPMQDVLGLDEKSATIQPHSKDSFRWRFYPPHLTAGMTKRLADYTKLYDR